MKKKDQKLTYRPEYDFSLIGIASHENDYRLSWAFNQKFDFYFIRVDNLEIKGAKNQVKQSFSVYNYEDESSKLMMDLISNRCEDGFLIEELKNIDFFLKISGGMPSGMLKKFLTDLKTIDVIITASLIDPNSLASKQKLIF
ncbi:MAG: IPExxxVDY family protein [Bacteroidia bacterium]|nr:IPExxxVDY family protein [Bacteroidia bacterium]